MADETEQQKFERETCERVESGRKMIEEWKKEKGLTGDNDPETECARLRARVEELEKWKADYHNVCEKLVEEQGALDCAVRALNNSTAEAAALRLERDALRDVILRNQSTYHTCNEPKFSPIAAPFTRRKKCPGCIRENQFAKALAAQPPEPSEDGGPVYCKNCKALLVVGRVPADGLCPRCRHLSEPAGRKVAGIDIGPDRFIQPTDPLPEPRPPSNPPPKPTDEEWMRGQGWTFCSQCSSDYSQSYVCGGGKHFPAWAVTIARGLDVKWEKTASCFGDDVQWLWIITRHEYDGPEYDEYTTPEFIALCEEKRNA